MEPQRRHDHRSPVPVVAWIVDMLQAKRRINSPPNMQRVISFDNVLATVIETPIAEKKTGTAEGEIFLVVSRDTVRNKYQPRAVEFSMPRLALAAEADLRRLIHFGIGKRLMP